MPRRIPLLVLLTILAIAISSEAFTSPIQQRTNLNNSDGIRHRTPPPTITHNPLYKPPQTYQQSSTTSLNLLGSDGGILGVGTPEIAVILLVGYFVLGPSDLYKLVKEIGKFIQNFRTLGAEAAKQFEGTMENQLELKELRKAQSELNEAFSFRRSINQYETGEAFDSTSFVDNANAAATAAAVGGGATATASDGTTVAVEEGTELPKKKRRLVRRKKKKAVEDEEEMNVPSEEDVYPDLDMMDANLTEEEKLRAERLDRLSGGSGSWGDEKGEEEEAVSSADWFNASEQDIAKEVLNQQPAVDPAASAFETNRFQSQLSAEEWNKQVMEKEDELGPCKLYIFVCGCIYFLVFIVCEHLLTLISNSSHKYKNSQYAKKTIIYKKNSINGNAAISHTRGGEKSSR